jgi:sugar O-acyltransferase (sialic acid O-acetyltransferase NeuD family)
VNIYIIGAGGHAKVVIDIILKRREFLNEEWDIKGILDDLYDPNLKKELFNIPVVGKICHVLELKNDDENYFVIAIGNNNIRSELSKKYPLKYCSIIHPTSVIGNDVKIGAGTVMMANSVVNSGSCIGKHNIINTAAIVDHDCFLGDHVHVSPNSAIAGGVKIGDRSWMGIGCCVIPGVSVGEDTIIGAGSVVLRDVPSNTKAFGNPCRGIERV